MNGKQDLVFICGFPSGGTDLVKTILNAHPNIYFNGEMPWLYQLRQSGFVGDSLMTARDAERLQSFLKERDLWHNVENIDASFYTETSTTLQSLLYNLFSQRERVIWGNKTPQNTEHIIELSQIFPEARFIIVVRDVRDVCLSYREKWGKDINWCAAKWSQRLQQGWITCQNLPPRQSLFVHFESLLQDSKTVCQKLCDFLGISFSLRMLEHHKYTERIIDGKRNYGRVILSNNQQKWRTGFSPRSVKRIEEIAYETMELFGYQPEYASQARPITNLEYHKGQFRDASALLLVGNRASDNNSLTKRVKILSDKIKDWQLRSK